MSLIFKLFHPLNPLLIDYAIKILVESTKERMALFGLGRDMCIRDPGEQK